MKFTSLVCLIGVASAGQIQDQLLVQKTQLLQKLESLDREIANLEDTAAASAAPAESTTTTAPAASTAAPAASTADPAESTATAAPADATADPEAASSNKPLYLGLGGVAVALGGFFLWKRAQNSEDNEGGQVDDLYSKFINHELSH